jgi:4-hydroxybenzoyl-CoA thioesterase
VFRYERPVRFADVDAARMVFFGRFCDYCHDALEALFEQIDGGYPRLTMVRDVGVPTVHIEALPVPGDMRALLEQHLVRC